MFRNILIKRKTNKLCIQSFNSGVEIVSKGYCVCDNITYVFVEIYKACEGFIHIFFAHNSVRLTDIIL
jgi:hypothetical protein